MSGGERPDQTTDDGVFADAKPASVALVTQVVSTQWSGVPNQILSHADPTFVTHLIATAEHVPQTCSLRRATPADAQTAYGAGEHPISGTGKKTQRTI